MDSVAMNAQLNHSFQDWLVQQEADLEELKQALASTNTPEHDFRFLITKILAHFDQYAHRRSVLARQDALAFFSPWWCSTLENSLSWLAGCRPSLSIRLVHAQPGNLSGATLEEYLNVVRGRGIAAGLEPAQLARIDDLEKVTMRREAGLEAHMAILQERVADKPLLALATGREDPGSSDGGGSSTSVRSAMDGYANGLRELMEAADKLRLETTKTLATEILTPRQAVEFLMVGKKLHLAMHEWGKDRDREMGRA